MTAEFAHATGNWLWRFSNLGKAQVNLTSNSLTTSLLVNRLFASNETGVLNSK